MKGYKKADKREPKYEKCLLTVGLKPFRLKGKGKFCSVRKETADKDVLIKSRISDRRIMQPM